MSDNVLEFDAALQTIGNILSTENEKVVDHFIEVEGLEALYWILNNCFSTTKNKTEVLWCISNVTAGSKLQIMEFIFREDLRDLVINKMVDSNPIELRREAAFVFTNLFTVFDDDECMLKLIRHNDYVIIRNLTCIL